MIKKKKKNVKITTFHWLNFVRNRFPSAMLLVQLPHLQQWPTRGLWCEVFLITFFIFHLSVVGNTTCAQYSFCLNFSAILNDNYNGYFVPFRARSGWRLKILQNVFYNAPIKVWPPPFIDVYKSGIYINYINRETR